MNINFMKMGFDFTLGAIGAVSLILICIGALFVLLNALGCIKTDDSDINKWHRSGLRIYTDNKTGVQYLRAGNAITPRLDGDGNVIIKGGAE